MTPQEQTSFLIEPLSTSTRSPDSEVSRDTQAGPAHELGARLASNKVLEKLRAINENINSLPSSQDDRLIDFKETAHLLGDISERSVRRLIASGKLPPPSRC